MSDVEVYYRDMCPYCTRVDQLLNAKSIDAKRINIWEVPGARDEMIQRAHGRTTTPQVFIHGEHIGGCDDLFTLENQGLLDHKLAAA